MLNFCIKKSNNDEWNKLSDSQKAAINEALEQAEAGLVTPAFEVIRKSREKYALINSKDLWQDISVEERQ